MKKTNTPSNSRRALLRGTGLALAFLSGSAPP